MRFTIDAAGNVIVFRCHPIDTETVSIGGETADAESRIDATATAASQS